LLLRSVTYCWCAAVLFPEQHLTTYLDVSLRRFDTVYPAAGNAASAVRLSCGELDILSNSSGWIDVCKNWS
ncbi:MAG: hypothetical protein ACLT09_08505, partial [Flavonifractor plautii]